MKNNKQLTFTKSNQVFKNDVFGELTLITDQNNVVWFIGEEVAEKLGYTDIKCALRDHCRNKMIVKKSDVFIKGETPLNGYNSNLRPREQELTLIKEPDMYRLIMRSDLPSAERFQDWVTDEVLPSIRKTGGYGNILRQSNIIADKGKYNQQFKNLTQQQCNRHKTISTQQMISEALYGKKPKQICNENGVRTARGFTDDEAKLMHQALESAIQGAPDKDPQEVINAVAPALLKIANNGKPLDYVPTEQPKALLTVTTYQLELPFVS